MKLWKISCKVGRYQFIICILLHKMFDPILFCLTPKKSKTKLLLKPRPFLDFSGFPVYAGVRRQFRLYTLFSTDQKTAGKSKTKTVTLLQWKFRHSIWVSKFSLYNITTESRKKLKWSRLKNNVIQQQQTFSNWQNLPI